MMMAKAADAGGNDQMGFAAGRNPLPQQPGGGVRSWCA